MEASTPPNLFNSGETCQLLIRAAASEYLCRDELYGRCLGIQVGVIPLSCTMYVCCWADHVRWHSEVDLPFVLKFVVF